MLSSLFSRLIPAFFGGEPAANGVSVSKEDAVDAAETGETEEYSDEYKTPKSRFWTEASKAKKTVAPQNGTLHQTESRLALLLSGRSDGHLQLSKEDSEEVLHAASERHFVIGGSGNCSVFSTSGSQSAVFLLEGVAGDPKAVVCGVTDGHGTSGAAIARAVASLLPRVVAEKLRRTEETEAAQGLETYSASATATCATCRTAGCPDATTGEHAAVDVTCSCGLPHGMDKSEPGSPLSDCSSSGGGVSWFSSSSEAGSPTGHSLPACPSSEEEPGDKTLNRKSSSCTFEEPQAPESECAGIPVMALLEPRILEEAFADVDKAVAEDLTLFPLCSGSSATVATLKGTQLTVAHIGDSHCVLGLESPALGSKDVQGIQLTVPHWAAEPQERRRIERLGGKVLVYPDDLNTGRVFSQAPGVLFGGLALSRSFGHILLKNNGVTSRPDVMRITVDDAARFLIVGTFNLWNALSTREAITVVSSCLNKQKAAEALVKAAELKCQALYGSASAKDVSALVFFFNV